MEQTHYNEMQCHFNLRQPKSDKPTTVYCVVNVDGKQLKISTGLKVYPNQWNNQCAIIDNICMEDRYNNIILNCKIFSMKKQFLEIKKYISNHLEINKIELIRTMNTNIRVSVLFKNAFYFYIDNKKESTQKQYESDWNVIKVIFDVKKFEDVTYERINNFFIAKNNKSASAIHSYMFLIKNILKTINNFDYTNLISELNKICLPKIDNNNRISLTNEQLQLIENVKLDDENDILLRDIFLFMCYTGLRVSEACQDFNGKRCKLNTLILLNPRITEILDAHAWNLSYTDINIVRNLRRNIFSKIEEFNTTYVTDDNKTLKLIDAITANTGRHTFITNMLHNGFSTEDLYLYIKIISKII